MTKKKKKSYENFCSKKKERFAFMVGKKRLVLYIMKDQLR